MGKRRLLGKDGLLLEKDAPRYFLEMVGKGEKILLCEFNGAFNEVDPVKVIDNLEAKNSRLEGDAYTAAESGGFDKLKRYEARVSLIKEIREAFDLVGNELDNELGLEADNA